MGHIQIGNTGLAVECRIGVERRSDIYCQIDKILSGARYYGVDATGQECKVYPYSKTYNPVIFQIVTTFTVINLSFKSIIEYS